MLRLLRQSRTILEIALASLYLVLDLINDLLHPEGAIGQEVIRREVLNNSAAAIAKARTAGVRIAYVRVGFSAGGREKPIYSPLLCGLHAAGAIALNGSGTHVHAAVAPQPEDFDIVKHRISPFYGTDLDLLIRAHTINRLYISGVSTSYAVSAAVREAHDRDLDITLLEDCCAASNQMEHESEIEILRPLCALVTTSAQVTFS